MMFYTISPDELQVMLEVLYQSRYRLSDSQLARLGQDPLDLTRDLLGKPVSGVVVRFAKSAA